MKIIDALNGKKFNIHTCKDSSVSPHQHSFFELAYVLSGNATHWLGKNKRKISKGDYLIMDYDAEHSYMSDEDNFVLVNFLFVSEFIDKTLKNRHNFSDIVNNYMIKLNNSVINVSPANCVFCDDDGYVGELLKRSLYEFENKDSGYEEIIRSKLIEIIILTMRKNDNSYPANTDPLCDYIIKYASENIVKKDILKSISDEVNYSISYLSRKFKENMGVSFMEYLQKLRIDQSMCLLGNTDKKVMEIAELCGYSDMKFFNSIFKKNVGMTPREFRNTFR